MIKRLHNKASEQKVPINREPETPESPPAVRPGLLPGRWAGILGASFLVAVCAGVLTYLAVSKPGADLAGAVLAGGAAFAGAVRLLDSIIA